MRSIIGNSLARPFAAEEANLPELSCVASLARLPVSVAVECPQLNAGINAPVAAREYEAISTPVESSNASVFLKDLNPVPFAKEQGERALYLDLIAGFSGPVAPVVTERKPNPVRVLSAPPFSRTASRTENEPPSMARSNRIRSAKKHALTLETVNRLPVNSRRTSILALLLSWKWGSILWVNRFMLSIPLAMRRRVSPAVLRKIGQSFLSVRGSLRRSWVDFKCDWSAMLDAMALPKMKRSVLRWLHQPIR